MRSLKVSILSVRHISDFATVPDDDKRLMKPIDDIMRAAQLAAALEVSGTPKPGNVHRNADYPDTRFEHYVAGSVALGPAVREVARRGVQVGFNRIGYGDIHIGKSIKQAVREVRAWHRGGNTHLGISLLFIPLAASAGVVIAESDGIRPNRLRSALSRIMKATTQQDALDVCDAILMADASALGRLRITSAPDLSRADYKDEIAKQGLSLYRLMEISSRWDNIAKELVTAMKISFNIGYGTFNKVYEETKDMNIAIVHTFLTILSKHPDTFIARKVGLKQEEQIIKAVEVGLAEARKVSKEAERVLGLGGLLSEEGRRALLRFDKKLRAQKGLLNPGTTADITASSLMIPILCGLRP